MTYRNQPDGGARYTTMDGDVLDQIAFNFYGTHENTTVLLYENNRDIALVTQPFVQGLEIYLPPKAPSKPVSQVQLWD